MDLLLKRDEPRGASRFDAHLSRGGPLLALLVLVPLLAVPGALLALPLLRLEHVGVLGALRVLVGVGFLWLAVLALRSSARGLLRRNGRVLTLLDDGLLVDFRHRGNRHFPDDMPSMVFIRAREVAGIDEVVVRVPARRDPDSEATTMEAAQFLDVRLAAVDTTRLDRVMRYERVRRAQGFISSRTRLALVTVAAPDRLRVAWRSNGHRIVPDLAPTAARLREGLQLSSHPARFELEARSGTEAAATHAAVGDTIQAATQLRAGTALTLTEAVARARELAEGTASPPSPGEDPYGRDPAAVAELEASLVAHARAGRTWKALSAARELHPELPLIEVRELTLAIRRSG